VEGTVTIRSTFELTIAGQDPPPETNTYSNVVKTGTSVTKRLTQGTGNDQMTVLFREDSTDAGTIAASGTRSVDLQTALDAFGEAMALADVALLYVEHKETSVASSISVQANGANGFTNLLSATANLTLRPGDFMLVGAFTAGNLPVAAGNKVLDVINDDGANAADYVVEVWGR
jgi:hypothetical protein